MAMLARARFGAAYFGHKKISFERRNARWFAVVGGTSLWPCPAGLAGPISACF
jgi:hypothetical protein